MFNDGEATNDDDAASSEIISKPSDFKDDFQIKFSNTKSNTQTIFTNERNHDNVDLPKKKAQAKYQTQHSSSASESDDFCVDINNDHDGIKTSKAVRKNKRCFTPSNSNYDDDESLIESCDDPEKTAEVVSKEADPNQTSGFSFRILTNRHKLILISISLSSFLSFLCLSLIAPFFPEEAHSKNVSDSVAGWIFGAFAFTQFVFSPVSGHLVPYLGIRFMYIGGLFIAAGCTILFGILTYIDTTDSNVTFVIYCFLLRAIMAMGCSFLQTASYTICAKEFPNSFSTVFGINEIFVGIGFMSGPAVGGLLYGSGGFMMPFAVIGGFMMLCVPFNFWLIPVENTVHEESDATKLSMLMLLRSPKTWINCLSTIVAAMIYSILDPTLEPHLNDTFSLSAEVIGLLFLLMSAFYAITSPIAGWVCDQVPDNRAVLIPGFIISAAGMIFLGPSDALGLQSIIGDQLWLNIICLIVLGVGASITLVPTFDIFITIAGDLGFEEDLGMYGIVAGVWGSSYAFGDFIGPSMGGILLEWRGFPFCCSITAAACLFMIPLLVTSWCWDTKCCRKGKRTPNETTIVIDESTPLLGDKEQDDRMETYPPLVEQSYT